MFIYLFERKTGKYIYVQIEQKDVTIIS